MEEIKLPLASSSSARTADDLESHQQDAFETPEEIELLQKNQIPTPKFCLMTACSVLKFLLPTSNERDDHVKLNQVRNFFQK